MPSICARLPVALILLAAACTSHDARRATALIDTLPGGISRVTSSGPTGWADSGGWRLVELAAIQPAQGTPGELIEPWDIAVDGQGRLYVADQKPDVIKVFDSAGTLVRLIGHEGDGPGELRSAYLAIRGNRLLVHDPSAQRTSLFDTSGTFIRSFHTVGNYYAPVALDAAWRAVLPLIFVLMPDAKDLPRRAYYRIRFDTIGHVLDTISVPQLTEERSWMVKVNDIPIMSVGVPFAPQTVVGYGRDSGLVYGASTDFSIIRTGAKRDTAFIMRRTWTPGSLSDSVRTARVEQMIQQFKSARMDEAALRNVFHLSDVPTTQPSFLRLLVDDAGNTWAQGLSMGGRTRFDVFDIGGSYLGVVTLPAEPTAYDPLVVDGNVLYLSTTDKNGFPEVRRWTIRGERRGQEVPR